MPKRHYFTLVFIRPLIGLALLLVFSLGVDKGLASESAASTSQMDELRPMPAVPEEGSGKVGLSSSDYRIGPSDLLEVEIFQVEELSGAERVNSRGFIKMPLIGPVQVAGLTQEEAEYLIADLYAEKYLQNPQVNIDIVEYVSQQITVMGAVESPGVFPIKGKTTLLQALALAGGVGRFADEDEVVVFRTNKDGMVVGYLVDLSDLKKGNKGDPEVIGSDKIVVPESGGASAVKGITDTLRGFIGFERY